MGICPACNGFEYISSACPTCGVNLKDQGRVMDYYDDYSPYMPIDQMKLEDGYPYDAMKGECPHLLSCSNCEFHTIIFVKE